MWAGTHWYKRGAQCDDFKGRLPEALLDRYAELHPGLAPMVRYAEVSTPLSTHHFARSPRGSICALSTGPERFLEPALTPRTPIATRFLAGVDMMAPGIAGHRRGDGPRRAGDGGGPNRSGRVATSSDHGTQAA
jgi:all-trans-retinol 13,14-reductase